MESGLMGFGATGSGGGAGIFEPSGKAAMLMAAANQAKRKVVAPVNAQDEAFKLPFKFGWKRELVSFLDLYIWNERAVGILDVNRCIWRHSLMDS